MANQQNQNAQSGSTTGQNKTENFSRTGSKERTSSGPADTGNLSEAAKDTAKGLYDQAKGTAGQAYGVATKRAQSTIEEQKTNLATGLTSVADSLHQVSENLRETDEQTGIAQMTAKYGEQIARQIEQISDYFEHRDPREMLKDVENFARRNPEIFLGAAFTVGLLAARFFKSFGKRRFSNGERLQQSNRADKPNEFSETGTGSVGNVSSLDQNAAGRRSDTANKTTGDATANAPRNI